MPGYTPLPAEEMKWERNELGLESSRLTTDGAMLTIVRGKAGDHVAPHGHTRGSLMYVVSGRINVDGHELVGGFGGKCNGSGFYPVDFLEDSVYVVARAANDEITTRD
ncbi:hypothetical protein ACWGCI_24285 [Streptomyces sp. NPDC054949]